MSPSNGLLEAGREQGHCPRSKLVQAICYPVGSVAPVFQQEKRECSKLPAP